MCREPFCLRKAEGFGSLLFNLKLSHVIQVVVEDQFVHHWLLITLEEAGLGRDQLLILSISGQVRRAHFSVRAFRLRV